MAQIDRDDPFMDDGLRLWIKKTAKRNFWRVAKWHDFDDLVAYGYLCYARTRIRYPDLVKPPLVYGQKARFVSMFKRIYMNEIHDLANARTRSIEEVAVADLSNPARRVYGGDESYLEALLGEHPEEGTLAVKLAQAPLCVQSFMRALDTPEGLMALRARLRVTSRHKESMNERLCKIAGVNPELIDMEWELRDAFAA